jgi:RNA polymerase sigma factor (sigma-70 family)
MPTSAVRRVIVHIRRSVMPEGDGELLGRFVERSDERALAALVERHGPMVWGVCRRLLSHHDAEDAFQVSFIVLARKAGSVNPREMVGNWLYGVARQAALQVKTARRREVQVTDMPDVEAPQDQWADVRPILDEELSRLPEPYRAVIVLSDLEGKTRKEVASLLGCPEGTVASRLVRARAMLAKRLTQRGVALSGGALAAVLSQNASAGVPASVLMSTIKAANLGQIPVKVAALAEGVLKTMLLTKLKSVMAVMVVAALVGLVGYGAAMGQQKGDTPQESEPKPQKVEDAVVKEKETTAWGKEVDCLQMGLALLPEDTHTIRLGEKVKFAVKLRNVGKAEATVTYGRLSDSAPEITTDTGGRVSVSMPPPSWVLYGPPLPPIKRALKSGETITLYNPEVAVEPEDRRAKVLGEMWLGTPTICVAPGKYKIAFGGMFLSHPKLTSGTVEFEVKDQVAWGKEVGGLQAGLSAEKRAYKHGETVTVALKVRNVGKEAVEFKHVWAFFVENPPMITDPDGKPVSLPKYLAEGMHGPSTPTVAPGKEVDLYDWKIGLQPKGEKGTFTIHGTGKFTVQSERIVGPTSANPNHPNPALDKLATGKLELEVKEKESFIAWGKELDGLQAGLSIAENRAYTHGETVKLVVRVRNVGKETVKFRYVRQFFLENPPAVTDGKGKSVPLERVRVYGFHALVPVDLAPGKEIEVGERQLELKPDLYGTGKFSVQYERLETPENDKTLSKLATGKLDLEVAPAPPEKK